MKEVGASTSYLGYAIFVTAKTIVVFGLDGKPVGEAPSMPAARKLVLRLRRAERERV